MILEIAIELVIADNTAFTVLTALHRLGYQDLARVERMEILALDLRPDADTTETAGRIARAEVLFNPNKHRLSFGLAAGPLTDPPGYEALVKDAQQDNQRLCGLLKTTFGLRALQSLERGVGWRLSERTGPAPPERLDWACRNLLCNTVAQTYQVRQSPLRRRLEEPASQTSKTLR